MCPKIYGFEDTGYNLFLGNEAEYKNISTDKKVGSLVAQSEFSIETRKSGVLIFQSIIYMWVTNTSGSRSS